MPELPEVETIVNDLNKKVLSRTFIDVWTDFPKNIKRPKSFGEFKKKIKGERIEKIWRRGKNIIFKLSGGKVLLIHQKMTGHLLLGKWQMKNKNWESEIGGPLFLDHKNYFLHIIFFLDNKRQLALSDMRKFAKVELWDESNFKKHADVNLLGPEPLESEFTLEKFLNIIPKKGKIKQILMNQSVVAGIGNIYSSEILWAAKIHPARDVSKISEREFKTIYTKIKEVLKKAISLRGDSFSDYRLIDGAKGRYQEAQKVYGREKQPCPRKDGGTIRGLKMGGRSAYFCPVCQV